MTFVITLRDDVTFWNGNPVTADDVVYSLQQSTNPASQWFGAFALVVPDPAVGIVATGPNEVTVRFVAPDSTFRDALAGQGGAVMEKAFGESGGRGPRHARRRTDVHRAVRARRGRLDARQ